MTLDQLAAELNALEIQVDAALNYDVLSDALVWEDEIPPLQGRRPSTFWCMRALLHHRTCMILKIKEGLDPQLWDDARSLFPNWPGFSVSRCRSSRELEEVYRQKSRRSLRRMEQLSDAMCDSNDTDE